MDLNGRSLKDQYHTPEEALRWALVRMAENSGQNKYLLAPLVDLSPSHFSKALNPNKSEDDSERRHHFPADRVAKFTEATGDSSFLLTLLDYLGYDPARLHEIRQPTKSQEQLIEEQNAKLDAATKMIQEVLTLRMPEPEARGKKEKRR